MANGILAWRNRVDLSGASVSAGSAEPNMPVSFLRDQAVAKAWRTDSTTDSYFTVDFGQDVAIQLLLINGTDIGASDTVRHRLSTSGGGATAGDKYDSGSINADTVAGYGYHVHTLDTERTGVRFWRMDITASSLSSQGYFEVGRAWASPIFRPGINFQYGATLQWQDAATVQTAARSGVEFVDETYMRRIRELQYNSLTKTETQAVEDLQREAGRHAQIVFVPDEDDTDINREAMLGRLEEISPIELGRLAPTFNATSFQLRESK